MSTYGHGPSARMLPGYGKGQHTIEGFKELEYDGQRLASELLDTFASPDYKPPRLPDVALELMHLSRNPSVAIDEIVGVLERDQLLAAEVLKLAQSPLYAGRNPSRTLRQAVVRMGLNAVRSVVMEAVLTMRVFKAPVYSGALEQLGKHSAVVAHVCRAISKYTPLDGEFAFLCGLLHDVGVAGVLLSLADLRPADELPDLLFLWPMIDRMHAHASGQLTNLWQLPDEIQWVVTNHHHFDAGGYPHPVAATVCLAEHIATALGVGLVPHQGPDRAQVVVDRTPHPVVERAESALDLSDEVRQTLAKQAEEVAVKVLATVSGRASGARL